MTNTNDDVPTIGEAVNGYQGLYPRHLEGPHFRVLSIRNGSITAHLVNIRSLDCSCRDDHYNVDDPEVCDHVAVALYQQPDLTTPSETAVSLPERDSRVPEAQDTAEDEEADTTESEATEDSHNGLTATDTGKIMEAYEQAGAPMHRLSFTNNGNEIVVTDDWQDMDDDEQGAYRDAEDQLDFVEIDWAETDNGQAYPERKYVPADAMDDVEEVLG